MDLDKQNEIVGLLLWSLAVFLFLSLSSYHPYDPSINTLSVSNQTQNVVGVVGATVADFCLQLCGGAAFAWPLMLLFLGWRRLRCQSSLSRPGSRLTAAVSLVVIAAIFLQIVVPAGTWAYTPGGALGELLLTRLLLPFIKPWGTYLLVFTGTFIALLVLTDHTLLELLERVRQRLQGQKAPIAPPVPARKTKNKPAEVAAPKDIKQVRPEVIRPVNKLAIASKKQAKKRPLVPAVAVGKEFTLPSFELLHEYTPSVQGDSDLEYHQIAERLQAALANFNIEVEVRGIQVGPTITQYQVTPAPGVKISRISSLESDLALALEADSVRVASIRGQSYIGIEVPNPRKDMVGLRELLIWADQNKNSGLLNVAFGKNIAGEPIFADLARMPHLLIAGATGAGKSVCINTLLVNLLFNATPDQLRLILIDPKRVELSVYSDIPHLLVPVITDVDKSASALRWACLEMERRLDCFTQIGVRQYTEYLQHYKKTQTPLPVEEREEMIPYIVIVIDEFSDLMMSAKKKKLVEDCVTRLSQMARAAGIHLVLATQRPSVDVITGLIKANFPARVAFRVSQKIDSRTILDRNGAEMLLGSGDMLMRHNDAALIRIQGSYISSEEVGAVVEFVREQRAPVYVEEVVSIDTDGNGGTEPLEDQDVLFDQAVDIINSQRYASTSMLQRRLKIGYNRAARIIEQLETQGLVGPADGSKPREVLFGPDWGDDHIDD